MTYIQIIVFNILSPLLFTQKKWDFINGVYDFASKSTKPKEPLPAMELAEQAIFYARELEMIV